MVGLSEEQDKRALERAREDQEVFLATKRDLRKRAYGTSNRWTDETEWIIKAVGGSGGRHLRTDQHVDKENLNQDPGNTAKGKIALFIEKHKYNYAEVKEDEIMRRHKRTFAFLITLWGIVLFSRML